MSIQEADKFTQDQNLNEDLRTSHEGEEGHCCGVVDDVYGYDVGDVED